MNNQISPIYFGKLTSAGDFVRYNASGKIVQELDQWFQEGLYHAKIRLNPNWDLAYKKAPAYYFLFNSPQYQQSLIGVFQPSWDSVGRKYPFFAALTLNHSEISVESRARLPAQYHDFTSNARSFISRLILGETTPDEFEASQHLESAPESGSSDNPYRNYKENTSLSEFIAQIQNYAGGEVFGNVIFNLAHLLKALKNQDIGQLTYGLRFPLGGQVTFMDYEVSFWLELILPKLVLFKGLPFLFYRQGDLQSRPYLFVFFKSPSPKNFAVILQPDLEIDTIYKLDHTVSSANDSSGSETVRELLEAVHPDQPNLADFLESWNASF